MKHAKLNHCAMLAVISSVLAACAAVGPDYQRPQNLAPAQFCEAENATETSDKLSVSSRWWTLYQDAELNTLMDKALQNNTDIRLAVARVLLKKPRWIFADEATSALDEVTEKILYAKLLANVQATKGSLISIAHRPNVAVFHNKLWELKKLPPDSPAQYRIQETVVSGVPA